MISKVALSKEKLFHANRNSLTCYEKGISAELCAEKELITRGYKILGKRVRTEYGEIDILAQKGEDVVAIEVKQRKTLDGARECLSIRQRKRIANAFLFIISNRNEVFENYRIDMVCLDAVGRFDYIENAFYIEDVIAC